MAQIKLTTEPSMAAFCRGLPDDLINLHSSHPAPMSPSQLTELIDFKPAQLQQILAQDYTPMAGSENLRSAIVQAHYRDTNPDDIMTTCGAQEAIFIILNALLKKDDRVVCLTPVFEPLYLQAKMADATVDTVPLLADQKWVIDWPALEKAVSNQTRLLIINFPHNPTGSHISEQELSKLVDLCRENDCWLLSDEVFRGLEHQSGERLPAAVDCYEKAISMAVMSKAYGMPAIRLGWIACRQARLRKQMMAVKRHLSICGSGLDENAALQILPHSQTIFNHHRRQLNQNRALLAENLTHLPHLDCHLPEAGATCYPRLKPNQGLSGEDFARHLAQHKAILVYPETCFVTDISGFRLSISHKNMAKYYHQLKTT
jgi:aspartate/methionine/tyrosine aminotransferase